MNDSLKVAASLYLTPQAAHQAKVEEEVSKIAITYNHVHDTKN